MNKYIEIIAGLIFLVLPIYGWILNIGGIGSAAITFLKGGAVWIVLLIGIFLLVLGINDLRS